MKINIQLDYPNEQIEYFASTKGFVEGELSDFVTQEITNILLNSITMPFKENTRKMIIGKMQSDLLEAEKAIDENAGQGITVAIEDPVENIISKNVVE